MIAAIAEQHDVGDLVLVDQGGQLMRAGAQPVDIERDNLHGRSSPGLTGEGLGGDVSSLTVAAPSQHGHSAANLATTDDDC